MKKFKVLKCPKCRTIQIISSKFLKCKFCNKSTILKKCWIYALFDTGTEASKFINIFKNELLKKKND